jgi:hypothetical protein
LLERIAAEYDFPVYTLDAESPAGRRLAQVTGQPRLPAIYMDLELIASGRLTEEELRQTIAKHTGLGGFIQTTLPADS